MACRSATRSCASRPVATPPPCSRSGYARVSGSRYRSKSPPTRCCCISPACAWAPCSCPSTSRTSLQEVEYFLRDSQPRLAVVRPQTAPCSKPRRAARRASRISRPSAADGDGTLPELARQAVRDADAAARAVGPTRLAALVYTSGTTGRSKGAMLTRGNLASNAAVLAHVWRFHGTDIRAAYAAAVPRAWSVHRDQHGARLRCGGAAAAEIRGGDGPAPPARRHGAHGSADALHAPAAGGRPRSPELRARAAVRVRLGTPAAGNASRILRAHGPRDSRALRDDRDTHEYLKPL